jgi:death-on-curing protein
VTAAEPLWLTSTDLLVLHDALLHEYGGRVGTRDLGLLASALARPQHHRAYGEHDVFALATAYADGIVRNHPFVDGNKRTAFMAAFVFLGANGQDLRAAEAEVVRMMLGLTDRSISEAEFASWLRARCRKRRAARKPKRRK